MAEHSELVAELAQIDKMSTQERLKLAKRRRLQQLKRWTQREKEFSSSKRRKDAAAVVKKSKKSDFKVHFVPSVMLLEAAARNDIEEVKRLLRLGVSPDSTNEDGLTALHQCCIDDSEEMMRLLLEFGANVNAKDSEHWTPLHAAATCGHIHIVKYLIVKGADLLAVNADGNMPYDICDDDSTLDYIENEMAKKGITQEMIDQTRAASEIQMLGDLKKLHAEGQSLDFRDKSGASLLHIAAANGFLSVMEFLLELRVAVNVCDDDLWQPVHAAACWGQPDAIEMLVQAGADLDARTKTGETPYEISEDIEVRERIMQLKFEMETKRGPQSNRLKRSHSQNTRSQSIRRTSIREKVQISRREAREEALLRQEKEDAAHLLDDDESKGSQDSQEKDHPDPELDPKDINLTFPPITGKDTLQRFKTKSDPEESPSKKTPPLIACDTPPSPNDKEQKQIEICATSNTGSGDNTTESTVIQQTSPVGQSVNVEIHVTVNTVPSYGPGLADLKKQRRSESQTSVVSRVDSNGKTSSLNGHFGTVEAGPYKPPPSPSDMPKKFHGDPSEVVGMYKKKKRCCVLM